MACFFCESKEHVSDNCDIFQNLQTRHSERYHRKYCLCLKFDPDPDSYCQCKTICDVCLQQHHIALCPIRDLKYPLLLRTEKDMIKLDLLILDRFYDLCNPIDKIKMQMTCKRFNNSFRKSEYKLCSIFDSKVVKQNVIYIGHAALTIKDNLEVAEANGNVIFNLQSVYLLNRNVTKMDLKILSRGCPITVHFYKCYHDNMSFKEIVEFFPYCIDLFIDVDSSIPLFRLNSGIPTKKNFNIKKISIRFYERFGFYSYIEELIELFRKNEDLKFSFITIIEDNESKFQYRLLFDLNLIKTIQPSNEEKYNLEFIFNNPFNEFTKIHYFHIDAAKTDIKFVQNIQEKREELERARIQKLCDELRAKT